MEVHKPYILVTNDDGIDSPGIYCLVQSLKKIANVFVAAPSRQQSAGSHSMNIDTPLRAVPFYKNGELFGLSISGTPVDCVKLAITTLMDERPDLIVSGINHGQNTSVNVLYSGTVAAAAEGMLYGIKSIAVSLDSFNYGVNCSQAAEIAAEIIGKLLPVEFPAGSLISVNIPALSMEDILGVKIVPLSGNLWKDKYIRRKDPFGREYFWFSGEFAVSGIEPDTDFWALKKGYVAITPIRFDLTDYNFLAQLSSLENNFTFTKTRLF